MITLLMLASSVTGVWARPAARRPAGVTSGDSAARPAEPRSRGTTLAQEQCPGDKQQSVLRAKLRVVDGRLGVDKQLSQKGQPGEIGFQPSPLFVCRASLSGDEARRRKFEKHLLNSLDKALRSLPRFYLTALVNDEQEKLLTSLPANERAEIIHVMGLGADNERSRALVKKYFPYVTKDLQLSVLDDLTIEEKKQFFAYLPVEEQDKVLEPLTDTERAALRAQKQAREERIKNKEPDPLPSPPPAGETERRVVSDFPGEGKKATGNWAEFLKVYNAWNGKRALTDEQRRESEPAAVLKAYLDANLDARALLSTAVYEFDPETDLADHTTGEISVRIADPIGDIGNEEDYKIVVPEPVTGVPGAEFLTPSRDRIIKILRPLKGQLWECRRIEAYINDYFIRGRTGYERTAEATNALDVCHQEGSGLLREPKLIKVRPVPYVLRIQLIGRMKDEEVRVALRELLTDDEMKMYRRNPKILGDCNDKNPAPDLRQGPPGAQPSPTPDGQQVKIECNQIEYQVLKGGADKLPYLNLINWRQQQAALKNAGFMSVLVEDKAESADEDDTESASEDDTDEDDDNDERVTPLYATIIIQKADADEESLIKNRPGAQGDGQQPAGNNTTAPASSPQTSPGGASTSDSETPAAAGPSNAADPGAGVGAGEAERPRVEKPRNNFVGGELIYRPGQGVRTYAVYSYTRPGKDTFTVRLGGDAGLLVTGDYDGGDLFRRRFERAFPFNVRGYSDTVSKRILNGVETDERRTGGLFRVATDWKTNPTVLTFFFEGARETVQLESGGVVNAKQNLTTVTFGGVYSRATRGVGNTTHWQLEPRLRVGLGLDGQPGFAVLGVTGLLHQYLPDNRDLIFDGRFDVASNRTPLFEQPSFGSEETVRGFRADDAIGLRQWALKTEFNAPVPGTSPDAAGLAKFIRHNVKLATFLDVGGIYRTTGSDAGVRVGPGGGVRVNYGGANLGLSWAYGIGDAHAGRGRGRFYFSVSRELPRRIR